MGNTGRLCVELAIVISQIGKWFTNQHLFYKYYHISLFMFAMFNVSPSSDLHGKGQTWYLTAHRLYLHDTSIFTSTHVHNAFYIIIPESGVSEVAPGFPFSRQNSM